VVVAAKGAYTGKPRPALVVQSDLFNPTHQSVTLCPITSDCVDAPLFRVSLPPGERTGLETASQIMVDKIVSVPRSAIGAQIGRCDARELDAAAVALRQWLELG
jgi:mRNA interferase MazF